MLTRWIRYGFEELKFLRSFNDLKIFYTQKLPFLAPRLTGRRIRDTNVPPSLQLEPTNHCNLNCICCSRGAMKRAKGYMSFALFQKIIDDAASVGVKRVHLYLHGEPLLHPKIVSMIAHIKTKGLGITMTTNGMPLSKNGVEAILLSGLNSSDHIVFSILGYSKEVHERIMKGVNHNQVLRNLSDFLSLRKKLGLNGPVIETVFYRMPENEHEESQFIKKWRGVVDHVHPAGAISQQFADHKSDGDIMAPRRKTCRNIWQRMTVFWNGDVTTCIADLDGNHVLGSLKEKSIQQIWNCSELLRIKELHKEEKFQDLALCSRCDW